MGHRQNKLQVRSSPQSNKRPNQNQAVHNVEQSPHRLSAGIVAVYGMCAQIAGAHTGIRGHNKIEVGQRLSRIT